MYSIFRPSIRNSIKSIINRRVRVKDSSHVLNRDFLTSEKKSCFTISCMKLVNFKVYDEPFSF